MPATPADRLALVTVPCLKDNYAFLVHDGLTGTTALVMTFLLTTLVAFYLGFHASKMEPRPEDRKDAEIAEGAGELGFFSPASYWPFALALSVAIAGLGRAYWYFWLIAIGAAAILATVGGLLFEYYVGQNATQS